MVTVVATHPNFMLLAMLTASIIIAAYTLRGVELAALAGHTIIWLDGRRVTRSDAPAPLPARSPAWILHEDLDVRHHARGWLVEVTDCLDREMQ